MFCLYLDILLCLIVYVTDLLMDTPLTKNFTNYLRLILTVYLNSSLKRLFF